MNACSACGEALRPGARFCSQCGQAIAPKCAGCGAELAANAKFCDQCGMPVAAPASAPVAAVPAAPAALPVADSFDSEDRAERRQLSVMFCDLVGSTELSQRLGLEELREVVRRYQAACATEIARFGGFIARYQGDGIMVYFGYPQAQEDDAERAVRAGLAVVDAVARISTVPTERLNMEIAVRVGIATGLVVAGDLIGEGSAEEQAVLGQTPNLAARLQGMAAPHEVIVDTATLRLATQLVEYEDRGRHPLKGFEAPVAIARVTGFGAVATRFDAARSRGRLTPLIGRDDEVATLQRRLEQAATGDGQVVLLSGEPGIGKSRLAQHFVDAASDAGSRVLRLQCSPHHGNSTFYPVIRALEGVVGARVDGDDAARLGALRALFDELRLDPTHRIGYLAGLLDIESSEAASAANLSGNLQKERTLAALLDVLGASVDDAPTVVLVEDVQWLDPSTRELVDLLVEGAATERLLVAMTLRPDSDAPWIGQPGVTLLSLSRLSPRQCAAMARLVTGAEALDDDDVGRIVAKTDGVPLFIEELTSLLAESKGSDGASESVFEIPATLQASLMARLDRLGDAKEVVQLGSIIGREFSTQLLRAIALPQDETRLLGQLPELADLLQRRGAQTNELYVFKQALMQEAAYGSLLRSKRQHYHARIANTLVGQFPEICDAQPELVARHLHESGERAKAVEWWLRAGQRALGLAANAEAINHLEQGREGLRDVTDAERRDVLELQLLTALGPALFATRGYAAPEVETVYARAEELCRGRSDLGDLMPVRWGLWAYHLVRANFDQASAAAEDMLTAAESHAAPELLVEALVAAGLIAYFRADHGAAIGYLERAASLDGPDRSRDFTRHSGQDAGVCGLAFLALALWHTGQFDAARERSARAIALARELDHPFSLAYALNFGAWLSMMLRDVDAASQRAEEEVALSEQLGFFWSTLGNVIRGWTMSLRGDARVGLERARAGFGAYRASGARLSETLQLAMEAEIALGAGDRAHAANAISQGLAAVEATGETFWHAELQRLAAGLHEDSASVEAALREALDTARAQGAVAIELRIANGLALVLNDAGREGEASVLLKAVRSRFRGDDEPDTQTADDLLDRLRAKQAAG